MEYTVETTINKPREKVIELVSNPENNKHWMPGYVGMEHISGEPGKEGAKSKLTFKMGKKNMEMVETIIKFDSPRAMAFTYDSGMMWNKVSITYSEIDANTTRWSAHNEFKGNNFMMKAMLFLMPGMFKKQSAKYLQHFKEFAEEGKSVVGTDRKEC